MRSLRSLRHISACSSLLKPHSYPVCRQIRHRHEEPHKWYFNTPPESSFRPGTSIPTRLLRSTLWSLLGLSVGFATLSGFTTWTWLNTAFTPGDEGDNLYMQMIQERLDNEPLSQLLDADPEWNTMQGLEHDGLDRCLRGSRGVHTRHWINPAKASLIVMIHFGEGTEGWPSVVHGGILSSYLHNAMELMAPFCFAPPKPHSTYDQDSWSELIQSGYFRADEFQICFERPVKSGEVYCIWICPAFVLGEELLTEAAALGEKSRMPKIEREDLSRTLIGSILQIDYFPYEANPGRRFIRYGNAVGKLEKVVVPEVKKPVQLTMEGKII